MSERGMAAIELAGRKACSKRQRGEPRECGEQVNLARYCHPIPLIRQSICRRGVGRKVTFPGAKLRFDSLITRTHEPPEGALQAWLSRDQVENRMAGRRRLDHPKWRFRSPGNCALRRINSMGKSPLPSQRREAPHGHHQLCAMEW